MARIHRVPPRCVVGGITTRSRRCSFTVRRMTSDSRPDPDDVREARKMFPATNAAAYLNTAAVGLASRELVGAYHRYIDDWAERGLDFVRGEAAGENARRTVASVIGADASDVA